MAVPGFSQTGNEPHPQQIPPKSDGGIHISGRHRQMVNAVIFCHLSHLSCWIVKDGCIYIKVSVFGVQCSALPLARKAASPPERRRINPPEKGRINLIKNAILFWFYHGFSRKFTEIKNNPVYKYAKLDFLCFSVPFPWLKKATYEVQDQHKDYR